MEEIGKPVNERIHRIPQSLSSSDLALPDFSNTAIAFSHLSDQKLKKMAWLFRQMNMPWLVRLGSWLLPALIRGRFPFVKQIVRQTIFEQFCGGRTLLESEKVIHSLFEANVYTILDYGAEGKETEQDFNLTMNETIRTIEFASQHQSVPMVSCKITGLARFGLLESFEAGRPSLVEEESEFRNVIKRMEAICHVAREKGVAVAFDAEESWIQDAIDYLVGEMMCRYNKEKVVVFNTFQLYRADRLQFLIDSFNRAKEQGFLLGAKLVRGAYMEKERQRAATMNCPSPIHPNKAATDDAYNTAVRFCVDNYKQIALVNASHNAKSAQLQAELIVKKNISKDHPHLWFCQLFGMSDNLTFNLANSGYNVAKYVPYGPVRDVIPYLIRRTQENTSVTGDLSREYGLILQEMKRRGLKK